MLKKHGEFFPFAASMSPDGVIAAVGGYDGDEHPRSQDVINLLTEAFREQAAAGQIKAGGICFDARVVPPGQVEKSDAICSRLEHEDGEAIEVYLPYRKGLLGRLKYGEIFASQGTPQIFGTSAG
jgi:hypothetical protein